MSDDPKSDDANVRPPEEQVKTESQEMPRPKKRHRFLRGLAWCGLLLVGIVGGAGADCYVVYGHGGFSASRGRRGGEHAGECYRWARGVEASVVQLVAPGD